jgi:hypothetical protein
MSRMRAAAGIVTVLLVCTLTHATAERFGIGALAADASRLPDALRGPFISDPAVVTELDCPEAAIRTQLVRCDGPLNFAKLIQEQAFRFSKIASPPGINPFNLPEAQKIVATIKDDLNEIRNDLPGLHEEFLSDAGSRVELVGVVNRMDRQFLGQQRESGCGEISVIYRFSYSIRDNLQVSRLPITMNIVFPAASGKLDCQAVARRWLDAIARRDDRTPAQIAKDLVEPESGPLASLVGADISRLELNMQAFRKPASTAQDFGTHASYVIRVFRWNGKVFEPTALPNQIERTALACGKNDSDTTCKSKKEARKRLIEYLQRPDVVARIDNGTLDVPGSLGVLSKRAISFSPGGSHRSGNQPYWKALEPEQQIISDDEIRVALQRARKARVRLSYIESVGDFRARLNDSTCSGCHQTRAIAGFHFPGSDRVGTPRPNAVLLPGSPHFYGDQPRRLDIVKAIAAGKSGQLPATMLTTSYSARPGSRYEKILQETELIGGWGGACLMPDAMKGSKRQWSCRSGLGCVQLFESQSDPGIGTCVPLGRQEIGDALQRGTVKSSAFAQDKYARVAPKSKDTRIPASALPSNPPLGNSYFGAHQEWFEGRDPETTPACTEQPRPSPECYDIRRDHLTGGFPAGMLRLSECIGLPKEATCGLLASSGFNDCIKKIGQGDFSVDLCFRYFTSFAGIRACDAAKPCRDDYICIKSMGYTPRNAAQKYNERLKRLKKDPYFEIVNDRPYDVNDHGQKRPDDAWVQRDDQRGLCIPPYFVFQFRSDGHPTPPTFMPSSYSLQR